MHPERIFPALMSSPGVPVPSSPYHHDPVLLEEALSFVPSAPTLTVDCTLGGGGHAEALLRRFPATELFGCDRDGEAVAAAGERLAPFGRRVLLRQLRFSALGGHLLAGSADFMLADLGASSHQFDTGPRGFSFTRDGPLDMRMDGGEQGPTAAGLLATLSRGELLDVLRRHGEERFASRIAAAIVAARDDVPLETTAQLAALVAAAVPARHHRRGFHPATRVFQALRIAVNDEMGELERLLDVALGLLKPGGRLAVISFHSLEDRAVKERFSQWETPCRCPTSMPYCVCGEVPRGSRLTRKPIIAGPEETARNPRSRSAKLRAFEKSPAPPLSGPSTGQEGKGAS